MLRKQGQQWMVGIPPILHSAHPQINVWECFKIDMNNFKIDMNGFNNFNLAGARSLTEEINPMQVNLTLTCKQCEIFIGNSSNILMMKFLGREFFKALKEILPSHNGRLHFFILKVIICFPKKPTESNKCQYLCFFFPFSRQLII